MPHVFQNKAKYLWGKRREDYCKTKNTLKSLKIEDFP